MARMDRLDVGTTVSRLRRQLRNWYIVGPLAYLVMLSPLRHALERSALARRVLTLRFRDGRTLRLHVNDMQAYVEIFILDDYDVDGADWAGAEVVVDAGANVGAATLWFAGRCPRARIYAVEPTAAARDLLQRNLDANGLSVRVEVVPVALGGHAGTAYLRADGPSVLNSVSDQAGTGTEVTMATVSEVLRERGVDHVDVFKLDCEGSEYDILLGDRADWLDRVEVLVGEWHPREGHGPDEISARLERAGLAVTLEPHPTLEGFGNFTARRR